MAWTEFTRAQHKRETARHPSDLERFDRNLNHGIPKGFCL